MTRLVKAKLATLDQLDGRTAAAKQALAVISASQPHGAAVLGAVVQDMGAKWISGGQVDLNLYSTLSGYCVVEKFDRYEAVLDAELLSVVAKLKG